MDQAAHNKIVSFIWGIADDGLRDLFVRGKYRDVSYWCDACGVVTRRVTCARSPLRADDSPRAFPSGTSELKDLHTSRLEIPLSISPSISLFHLHHALPESSEA
jgi:hypothetical protein